MPSMLGNLGSVPVLQTPSTTTNNTEGNYQNSYKFGKYLGHKLYLSVFFREIEPLGICVCARVRIHTHGGTHYKGFTGL